MASLSIVYVVTWDSPEGVGGFEWNVSREAAETFHHELDNPMSEIHAVDLPDDPTIRGDAWALTEWLTEWDDARISAGLV
jgi:hypothetical protein